MAKEYVIRGLGTRFPGHSLCPRCRGSGRVPVKQTIRDPRFPIGRTVIVSRRCPLCRGTGYIYTGGIEYKTKVFGGPLGQFYKPTLLKKPRKQPEAKKLSIEIFSRRKPTMRAI